MTGLFLYAWLLFPLLLIGASAGAGLLVRRLSGGALSGVLLLPVGFALTVALCALGTSSTSFAPHTGALAVIVAVIGFLLELPGLRRSSRPGRLGWRPSGSFAYPTVAAFAGFAVFAAPVVLTGTPTWTGFGRIVDIAFQMDFSQHLVEAGRSVPPPTSSFNLTIEGLAGNGYPGGAQATLGALAGVIHTSVAWCYQAYLAVTAAMGALALYALLRRVLANRLICCIGAAVAIQPNVLYAYALEAGIKELTTAALLLLVAAIVTEWLTKRPTSVRSALPLAPAMAAALAAFSYGALPWAGLILLGAFVVSMLAGGARLRTLGAWAVAAVATTLLAIPTVISSLKLYGTAKQAAQGVVEVGLGNLTAPIPEISTVGVWISNDYRFPQFAHANASHAFDYLIIALGALGILAALWKRRWMIAVFGVTGAIAITYVVAHAGPWVELKGFTISATIFLAMAFVGAGWLATAHPRRLALPVRGAGWLGVLAVSGAVLYGNALTYHDISLAPAARYRQLEQIGNRFAGTSSALFPEFDEYSELFLRHEHGYELVRPPALHVRPGAVNLPPGQFPFAYDLNEFELSFVQSFPLLVIARSPVASSAPANFDLVDKTPEFEVWRRTRPASEVVEHLPLSGSPTERTPAFCRNVTRDLRRAGAGSRLAYVPTGPRVSLIPTQVSHPSYWHTVGPEALRAYGAGAIEGDISTPAAGTYEVSMPGSVGRPITLYVDGHRAGSVAYQFRYPGQFLRYGRVYLGPGTHHVRLLRGNGSLAPGSGDGPDTDSGVIGPLIFTRESPEDGKLVIVPGSEASRVCAAPVGYEWIEILRPAGAA
jgi:hypothetical protein